MSVKISRFADLLMGEESCEGLAPSGSKGVALGAGAPLAVDALAIPKKERRHCSGS
jgi:hypothetical protein